jgi:Tetracyclin repressor-like, C-terminal domain
VQVVADAHRLGVLDDAISVGLSPAVAGEMVDIGRRLDLELPADVAARGFTAWSFLIGAITLDLFGQLNNVIADRAALFAHEVERVGRRVVGFTSARVPVRRAGRA